MNRTIFILLSIYCVMAEGAPTSVRLATDARTMIDVLRESTVAGCAFDLTATVTYVSTNRANENTNVALQDETGAALCRAERRRWPNKTMPVPGARARLQGYFEKSARGLNFAVLTNYVELSRGPVPQPLNISISDLKDGQHYFRLCKRTGILRDVIFNETAPDWLLLSICGPDGAILGSVPITDDRDYAHLSDRIGCEISAPGFFVPYDHGLQGQFNCKFKIAGTDQISIRDRAASAIELSDAFDNLSMTRSSDIISLGRRSVTGWIVAAWQKNGAMLRTANGDYFILALARDEALPRYGEYVKATGLPVSDLYQITLLNADLIRQNGPPIETKEAETGSIKLLIRDKSGRKRINYSSQGRTIAITGRVQDIAIDDGTCRLSIEGVSSPITVDASANPSTLASVRNGCLIALKGTCVAEVESPQLNTKFHRLGGIRIVPHSPADLTILESPSWWATIPWQTVSFCLSAGLLLIAVWNIFLRRLAEKRGRELAGETLARAVSDLKVYERTRLAVELHDSIAQSLTGIALELDTAELVESHEHDKMKKHLAVASGALRSCRAELRNCLWDLRHETLENDNVESAIRNTLQPHCGSANLSVRFSAPRDRISDNTTHAILRIIRELTVNALRHGKATTVRIAGAIEGDWLKFSVTDNGCGFDPENCPNDEQGHYGLLGIRERINTFEGQLQINSTPGNGTKVTIALRMPREQEGIV